MNKAQASKINLFERVVADLDDWDTALTAALTDIDTAENMGSDEYFVAARMRLHTVLNEMKQTIEFLKLKEQILNDITADVGEAFSAHPSVVERIQSTE